MTHKKDLKKRIKSLQTGVNKILAPINKTIEKIIPEGEAMATRNKKGDMFVKPTFDTMKFVAKMS